MAVATVLFVGLDWLLGDRAGQSFLAPRATDLWLSVALGMALGAATMLWERYQLRSQRGHLLAFHQAPLRDRLSWSFQRTNLLQGGWIVLAQLALLGWCYFSGVFVLPALFAMNAVHFAGNRRLAGEFNEELRRRARYRQSRPEPTPSA
jgi:hypothetical protein